MARIVPATNEWISEAAHVIKSGGLVAFPTETVYGLGADATNSEAVAKIFAAKGRPATNPLIVHVARVDQLKDVAAEVDDLALQLAHSFWPGPLTLVLPKSPSISNLATAGGLTVGVRIPNHQIALDFLTSAGCPIAAPSANRSEEVSPTTAQHVADSLGKYVDLILDGGPCNVGIESTVLNMTVYPPETLRLGSVSADQISDVIGVKPSVLTRSSGIAQSPGQMHRHYAPRTRTQISDDAFSEAKRFSGKTVVVTHVISKSENEIISLRLPDNPTDYAKHLYALLRKADAGDFDLILVQSVPNTSDWDAIRDRLSRATGPAK